MIAMDTLRDSSALLFEHVRMLRRKLHQYPEIGFDLPRTKELVCNELSRLPLRLSDDVGGGIVADLIVNPDKPFLALRADMDALPMHEETGLPYASCIPGQAHMCGHDAHTAMLIGVAKIICMHSSTLNTNVRFLFQPNEESQPGGAFSMIQDGCLHNVAEIYGLHVWPGRPVGWIGTRSGALMAKPDSFSLTIRGQGGHASTPHHCIDPVLAGGQFLLQAQNIISRQLDPLDATVLSITCFNAGTAYNIIPDTAVLQGTVRTLRKGLSDQIQKAMRRILDGLACSHGIHFDLAYTEGFPVLINAEEQTAKAVRTLKKQGATIEDDMPPVMGGEDFAHYLERIPGCFFFLGCGVVQTNGRGYLHNAAFNLDENCLPVGMAALAALALSYGCSKNT